jgi:membrane peptidoglycan carboxypeptidase
LRKQNGNSLKYCFSYLGKINFNKITSDDDNLGVAIGGTPYGTNTLEMAAAYATIENEGEYRQPSCVIRITNTEGETVTEDRQGVREVYDINTTKQLIESMQAVFYADYGSAKKVPVDGQDCAGKTGTTDNYTNGWMCGFTKYYTTAVWCGNDDNTSAANNSGATFAGPIWKKFMTVMHEGLARKEFDTKVVGLNTGKKEDEQDNDSFNDDGGLWSNWNTWTDWFNTETKKPEPTLKPEPTPEPTPEPVKTKKPKKNDDSNDDDDNDDDEDYAEETQSPHVNDDNQEPDVQPEEPLNNDDNNNNNDNWNDNNWDNNNNW